MCCFFLFSLAQNTYVPDDNFEQFLIDTGIDPGPLDNYVSTANIETIDALNINNLNIADLTGIEDFTSLVKLWCNFNQLITLNLSNNTELNELECRNNQLTSLMLSPSNKLIWLTCYSNQLSTLDLRQNTSLQSLSASNNQLINIDLGYNSALETINVSSNQLVSLDVTQNTALRFLYCNDNPMTSLDVKNGNNTIISFFYAVNNPNLTCINVDDAVYSTSNWTEIDAHHYFDENCPALSIDQFESPILSIYPNPVIDLLTFDLNKTVNYSLINLNGQILKKGELNQKENILNVSDLSTGLYFLKISTDKGGVTKKLIKQ